MQDPGTYEGQKNLDGKRHGEGTYVYANGFFTYEGQWVNNLKHGQGKLLFGDQSWYEGSFQNGEIEGEGTRIWNACIPYAGEFKRGAEYVGQFLAGEKHGQGKLVDVDGVIYEGAWQKNKRHGRGVLTGTDGAIYDGEFADHAQTGQGTLTRTNGVKYEGQWLQGERHGIGLMNWPSGTVYDGGWAKNAFQGQGELRAKSGGDEPLRVYSGVWEDGKPTTQAIAMSFKEGVNVDNDSADEGENDMPSRVATPQAPGDPKAKARPGSRNDKAGGGTPSPTELAAKPPMVLVIGEPTPSFHVRCKDAEGTITAYESGRMLAVDLRRHAPKEVGDKKKGGKKTPEPEEPEAPPEILSTVRLGQVPTDAGVALFETLVMPTEITQTTYDGEYVLAIVDATSSDHPLLNFTPISAETSPLVPVKVEEPVSDEVVAEVEPPKGKKK